MGGGLYRRSSPTALGGEGDKEKFMRNSSEGK